MISNWYLSMKLAGLFRTLTFSNDMIDMAADLTTENCRNRAESCGAVSPALGCLGRDLE